MFVHEEKNPKTWHELLASDTGLFKKIPKKNNIVGPHLTEKGQIQGDLMALEINHLMENGSPEQKAYFENLLDQDEQKAYEYLLTITNSIKTWEDDMQVISYARSLLDVKLKNMKNTAYKLAQSINYEKHEKIPETIKRHIPDHFFDVDITENDFKSLLDKLSASEIEIEKKLEKLSDYLRERRAKMPFLFENMRYI